MKEIEEWKRDASIRGKNGAAFLAAGACVWLLITLLHLLPVSMQVQQIGSLSLTGLVFPGAVLFSALLGASWQLEGNPLSSLGTVLNAALLPYLPLVFWAYSAAPGQMVLFLAVITAAHFLPFGWMYAQRLYYMAAPGMVLVLFVVSIGPAWVVPLSMSVMLALTGGIGLYAAGVRSASLNTAA
ncbi:DUF7010 family protein [Alkalicoccus chagannorensis]|uniref:DUF7010 family protein n=1 Tax=Alkalicoccus chagannorensis TaxID=427072 RepID=UPI0003FB64B7|nr:hypothetical protein [Alkalicoccus chagannorensis]